MEETIKNCAEDVPLEERINSAIGKGKINYVPHHGIYHPKKASQIRVFFDCSATCKGTSLNKNLLSRPDMTNSLTGVPCRFCQERVAVTCDVKGTFHQFFVNKVFAGIIGQSLVQKIHRNINNLISSRLCTKIVLN